MEIIGSGAQADVYKDGSKAIKLFKYNIQKEEIENEVNLQKMAFDYGLPVPQVFDMVEINGKYGIVMEYIDGIPIGSIVLNNMSKLNDYLIKSIEIQDNIHKIETDGFPGMKNTLKNQILRANELNITKKNEILEKLETTLFGNKLYHGDMHILNLIETSNGIKIIDWACAGSGNPDADIYRTYLLYRVTREYIAELYLDTYCELKKLDKHKILAWGPIMAAARLGEYTKDGKERDILRGIINILP